MFKMHNNAQLQLDRQTPRLLYTLKGLCSRMWYWFLILDFIKYVGLHPDRQVCIEIIQHRNLLLTFNATLKEKK